MHIERVYGRYNQSSSPYWLWRDHFVPQLHCSKSRVLILCKNVFSSSSAKVNRVNQTKWASSKVSVFSMNFVPYFLQCSGATKVKDKDQGLITTKYIVSPYTPKQTQKGF